MPKSITWRTDDGIDIFATYFQVANPLAVLLITHGWGDHQGRYSDTIEQFLNRGIAVVAHDFRGHGRSGGKRGYSPSFEVFRDDLGLAISETKATVDESVPIFLYGQSFGGLLTLNYLLRNSAEIKTDARVGGAIITSPLLGLKMKVPRWKLVAGKTLCAVYPRMTLKSGIDLSKLSRNPEHAAKIAADPLRQGRISAQVFFGMRKAMKWTMDNAKRLPCPTILMHGEADRVTSPSFSKQFAENSSDKLELRLWPEMYHELHTEIDNEQIYATMLDWLTSQAERTRG